jgi:transcription elongation factor Elf1
MDENKRMIIEVAYCERCGQDTPWRIARQAYRGLPGCPLCGSAQVSRCMREETPEERARTLENLQARKS